MKYKVENNALVIGAGVIGLTTAIVLQNKGYGVTIVADKFAPDLTSCVAGGLWEWPPAVCGYHGTPRSLERSKIFCMDSYNQFKMLSSIEESGVYLRDVSFFFKKPLEELPIDLHKMNELMYKVDGFVRDKDLAKKNGINNLGIVDSYKHSTPTIDTEQYMQYLMQQVIALDCTIIKDKIQGSIIDEENNLLAKYDCNFIVNCTGLGSIDIGPNMYPLRGSLIRIKDPDRIIKQSFCMSHDEKQDMQDIIFIVPKGKDMILLGGTAEANQWNTSLDFTYKEISEMYKRNTTFLPQLKDLEIDLKEPVRSGLRPFTEDNICLDRTPGTKIIHNYGHGGAGVTLSWGCAKEVARIADKIMSEELSNDDYAQYIVHAIDSDKKTVFVLQNVMSHRANFMHIKNPDINLIFLSSKSALSKLIPSQYDNFNLVKAVDNFNAFGVNEELSNIAKKFTISLKNARIITNDDLCVGLAAELREMNDIIGDKPYLSMQFADKQSTKQSLAGSQIKIPKNLVFDKGRYKIEGEKYLQEIIDIIGDKIFIKPTVGAGSESTARIKGITRLKEWCDDNVTSNKVFEIDEFIDGKLYNASLVIQNAEIIYFALLEHVRPNDEFLQGKTLGNIILKNDDPRFHIYRSYCENLILSLKNGYPSNGVINIDFFVQEDDQIVLMEIASRAPGGLISIMYEKCVNLHLEEAHLKLSMGETLDFKDNESNTHAAYVIYPCIDDKVREIITPNLESHSKYVWRIYPEKVLAASKSMRDVAVGIMIWNDDKVALQRDYDYLCSNPIYKGYKKTEEEIYGTIQVIQNKKLQLTEESLEQLLETTLSLEQLLETTLSLEQLLETTLSNVKFEHNQEINYLGDASMD